MSPAEAEEVTRVFDRVKNWPQALRIALVRHILETLEESPAVEEPPRRIPLDQIFGMLKTDAPPPTDEECERIIEEERMRRRGLIGAFRCDADLLDQAVDHAMKVREERTWRLNAGE